MQTPEGEIPRRHHDSSRVYVEKYLQLKYTVSIPENILISLSEAAWNRWVMMTFLFTPGSERWLGWCKTENPQRDCFKLILWHLFFSRTSILFSVTCYQFWKLWTKKTPVRRTRSYEVESLPDRSLSFTNLWLETICQTHFLSTNKPEEWING